MFSSVSFLKSQYPDPPGGSVIDDKDPPFFAFVFVCFVCPNKPMTTTSKQCCMAGVCKTSWFDVAWCILLTGWAMHYVITHISSHSGSVIPPENL